MDSIWAPNFHSIRLHSPEWRKNVLLTIQFELVVWKEGGEEDEEDEEVGEERENGIGIAR